MIEVGVVVANNFECVQDIVHQPVGLREEVILSWDFVSQATRSDDSARKVALVHHFVVALIALTNRLVDVNVPVLREDWLDLELGQPAKFKLEGQSRLAMSNARVFLERWATESEVTWIRAVLVPTDERETSNSACK